MRKSIQNLLIACCLVASATALLSVPFIEEKCIVCGERYADPILPNGQHRLLKPNELRLLSVIEWYFDDVDDLHFVCVPDFVKGIRFNIEVK